MSETQSVVGRLIRTSTGELRWPVETAAAVVGGGAATALELSTALFSQTVGFESSFLIAAAIGGLLGGWIARGLNRTYNRYTDNTTTNEL